MSSTLIRRVMRNDYLFSLFSKLMSALGSMVSAAITARYLGPALKGELNYALNTITLAVMVVNLGFFQSYPFDKRQGMPRQYERYVDIFALQFLVYVSLAVLCAACAGWSAMLLPVLLLPAQTLMQQLAMVLLVENIGYRQRVQLVAQGLNIACLLAAFFCAPPSVPLMLGLYIAKDLFIILCYLAKARYWPRPFRAERKLVVRLLTLGVLPMLSALLNNLNYKVDVLIMRLYCDFREIGLYTAGTSFAGYAWLIPDAFKDVLFARTAKDDAVRDIVLSIKVNLYLLFAVILVFVVAGEYILLLLNGPAFADAFSVTLLILLGAPSMIFFKLIGPLYIAQGRRTFCFLALTSSVLINVFANFLTIPTYGMIGAAVSSAVSYALCGIVFYISFVRTYGLRWYAALIITREDVRLLTRHARALFARVSGASPHEAGAIRQQ